MKKAGFISVLLFVAFAVPMTAQIGEPNVEVAKLWWPDLTATWTPIGWPDHYLKYSVFYNGDIVIAPKAESLRPHSQIEKWKDEDLQISFCSSTDGHPWQIPVKDTHMRLTEDGGLGNQCWIDSHEAPVLRTEYRHKDGYVLCADIFAHIPSGGPVQTALEPEYAWLRLTVTHVDSYYHPERVKMSALITKRLIYHQVYRPLMATELKPLTLEKTPGGARVMNSDGNVRLSVLGAVAGDPGEQGTGVSLACISPSQYNLCVDLPCKEGAYVDLLIPMLPDRPEDTAAEERITREKALDAADAYWASLKPATAARFHVPEPFLNDALEANLKYLPVLGEKDYQSGEYCYLSSTLVYEGLWTTPGSMIFHMFLDQMGWYDMTEHYLHVFKDRQGTATAPGPSYSPHPGYFSSPRYIAAIDWLTDHGAMMHQIATHALLTGDQDFIEEWTGPLVAACDFIKDMSLREHSGIAGLLPPAYSTDEAMPQQSTWNLAWNYKGLVTTIRLLERIGHPRASEFADFASQYKETFLKAYRKVCEDGPRWTDSEGRLRYQPPTALFSEGRPNIPDWMLVHAEGLPEGYTFMSDGFYLDGGPLCLVWSGLMDVDDPIMKDLIDFFREGPNWKLQNTGSPYEPLDRAVLVHEMSSCEPCYSFNMFHNWKNGDRERYLEGMYSLLVGSISQKTYISCEHRHKVQGTLFSYPLAFYFEKLAVLDDQIEPGSLHLLRFCPLAWVSKEDKTELAGMPTEFGPVDLSFKLSGDGKTLDMEFSHAWGNTSGKDTIHGAPERIVIHIPPVPGLKKVRINGKVYPATKGDVVLKG